MILAVTGHRPPKLGGYDPKNPVAAQVIQELNAQLEALRPEWLISGMALGVDQWAACVALLRGIRVWAAVPFEGQESKWPSDSQSTYHGLLRLAQKVTIVSPGGYSACKMQVRNEFMVDHADAVLAVWDGSTGGTANCVRYAQSKGRTLYRITPKRRK